MRLEHRFPAPFTPRQLSMLCFLACIRIGFEAMQRKELPK